jgi:hypothetical protein
MTTNVCEYFSFKAEFADRFAVGTRLFRSSGGSKFDVFNAKGIKRFSNFDFFRCIKEGVRKLFTFSLYKR